MNTPFALKKNREMDAFALQKKIKENAEELTTYLKDLNSWTRDIANTDTELKKAKAARVLYNTIFYKTIRIFSSEIASCKKQ